MRCKIVPRWSTYLTPYVEWTRQMNATIWSCLGVQTLRQSDLRRASTTARQRCLTIKVDNLRIQRHRIFVYHEPAKLTNVDIASGEDGRNGLSQGAPFNWRWSSIGEGGKERVTMGAWRIGKSNSKLPEKIQGRSSIKTNLAGQRQPTAARKRCVMYLTRTPYVWTRYFGHLANRKMLT